MFVNKYLPYKNTKIRHITWNLTPKWSIKHYLYKSKFGLKKEHVL